MDALRNFIYELVDDFARRAAEPIKVDRAREQGASLLDPLEVELIARPLVVRQLDLLIVDLDYGIVLDYLWPLWSDFCLVGMEFEGVAVDGEGVAVLSVVKADQEFPPELLLIQGHGEEGGVLEALAE